MYTNIESKIEQFLDTPFVPRGSEVLPKCKINERCRKDKADGSEKEREGLSFKARLML